MSSCLWESLCGHNITSRRKQKKKTDLVNFVTEKPSGFLQRMVLEVPRIAIITDTTCYRIMLCALNKKKTRCEHGTAFIIK